MHEQSDINAKTVVKFGLILLIVAVFVHVLIGGIFRYFDQSRVKADPQLSPLFPKGRQVPPPPLLQTSPRHDLQEALRDQDRILNSYGWVDERNGIVRIPIEQAMKLIVQREGAKAQSEEEAAK